MYLCFKHQGQYKNHGQFLDNNQRTINDPNEIILHNDYAEIYLYDNIGEHINTAIIDIDDVDRVRKLKWRITKKRNKTYVITGRGNNQCYLARYIMNYNGNLEVDHVNSNELDNRKSNLRIIERKLNIVNVKPRRTNKTGIRGVSFDNTNQKFSVDFACFGRRYYFKSVDNIQFAVYMRLVCERIMLREFRNESNDNNIKMYICGIPSKTKNELEQYVRSKLFCDEREYNAS